MSDFLDDAINGGSDDFDFDKLIGIDSSKLTDYMPTQSNSDILQSIGMTFDQEAGGAGEWFFSDPGVQAGFAEMANSGNDYMPAASRSAASLAAPKTVEASNPSGGVGMIGKITGWMGKNKSLTEMLAKGVAGMAAGSQAKSNAKAAASSRIAEMQAKDQLDQQANARYSASVSGLRSPGLINRQLPLKRLGGQQIYTNGRITG